MGKFGEWWTEVKDTLNDLGVAEGERAPLIRQALQGIAKTEFARRQREARREGHGTDVGSILEAMREVFDAGVEGALLDARLDLKQRPGEDIMRYRVRFLEVMDGLAGYGYTHTKRQLLTMFLHGARHRSKLTDARPATIDEAVAKAVEHGIHDAHKPTHVAPIGEARCYNCGSNDGHTSRECPKPQQRGLCWRWGKKGHRRAQCKGEEGKGNPE
jgi:hypothetical protein